MSPVAEPAAAEEPSSGSVPDPTLLQLARGGSGWARAGMAALVVLTLVGLLSLTVLRPGKPVGGGGTVQVDGTPRFEFGYARGELKVAEQQGGGVVMVDARTEDQGSRLVITPLQLPAYEGSPSGALPLAAGEAQRKIQTRFDPGTVRFQDEGLVNVAANPGYQLSYVAKRDGETWYGRALIVANDVDGNRAALLVDGQEERSSRIVGPRAVGRQGDLRRPMRSLEFR